MKSLSRIIVPLFTLWLIAWIWLSWGAIQDDALIHLRYADYLHRVHFITYDGVHASYGASSLLYVGLLAILRSWTASPLLSRGVSTVAHLCLFAGVAALYLRSVRSASLRVQLLALSVLFLIVVPSAVRWLDDGMETGIAMGLVGTAAWLTHRLSLQSEPRAVEFFPPLLLGFLLVFLRPELGVVALFSSAILVLAAAGPVQSGWLARALRSIPGRSHFLAGAMLAAAAIRLVMHSFLPDTARAKAHGIHTFFPALGAAPQVIGGALLFGIGSLLLWLLSAVIVLRQRHVRLLPTLLANALFPCVLLAAAARGQEIQGVRYLIWPLFFSILWNLFELWYIDAAFPQDISPGSQRQPGCVPLIVFLGCCIALLPIDARLMYRVLTTRAHTMKLFMGQDLASVLRGQLGVAADVGYISYFSQGTICDLSGLVNGPAAAALSSRQRAIRCAAQHPSFAFVDADQAGGLAPLIDFTGWRVCGQYDLGDMRKPDRHFLLVEPQDVAAVCHATGFTPAPVSLARAPSAYPKG